MSIGRMRFRVSHARFCVGFPLALYTACNAVNIDKLAKWFTLRGGLDVMGLSAYLLAGLCLFIAVFIVFAHKLTIKPLAILFVLTSAAATYFVSKYNVAIDSSMVLNVFHTDPTELGQLVSIHMLPYAVMLIVLPIVVVLAADIAFEPHGRYLLGSVKLFGAATGIAIATLYLNHNAVIRAGNVSDKYIVYSLVPINLIWSSANAANKSVKPLFGPSAQDANIRGRIAVPGNLVVVLAIGESSRRLNFSLYEYARNRTNPELRDVEGLHLLNGTARRGSTLDALPEILKKSNMTLPGIVSKLGIPTACYVNFTLYDNCATVGETKVTDCGHGGKCFDEDVIPLLEENLRSYSSGQRFVVLHLGGGSHGPVYSDRFPPEFQKFQPMCRDADVANMCSLEQLYNSYDNTILYVDHVLARILQVLDRSAAPYVFIYISDHGESLMEEGRMFHGMPPGMKLPSEQAQVPLIVKASVPISIVERTEYYQPDVFDTVLDLFSIESPNFDKAGSFIRNP